VAKKRQKNRPSNRRLHKTKQLVTSCKIRHSNRLVKNQQRQQEKHFSKSPSHNIHTRSNLAKQKEELPRPNIQAKALRRRRKPRLIRAKARPTRFEILWFHWRSHFQKFIDSNIIFLEQESRSRQKNTVMGLRGKNI